MEINKIYSVFWSPTGNTKKIVNYIAKNIQGKLNADLEIVDLTLKQNREKVYEFTNSDLVVFGVPTYAGRIPNKIVSDIQKGMKGNKTPIVCVVTYGNRNYDFSLKESISIMMENDFFPVGAAACVCEHAFSSRLASKRPDLSDFKEISVFSNTIADNMRLYEYKKENMDIEIGPYYIPLKEDYTPAKFLKATPETDRSLCTDCKMCVKVCPMDSIDFLDVSKMNGICIKCQACIHACPVHARYFNHEDFLSHVKMLEKIYLEFKENKFWVR